MFNHLIKLAFHLLVVAIYVVFLKHCNRVNDELNAKYQGREEFMGQWKYLTHLNVALQVCSLTRNFGQGFPPPHTPIIVRAV